MNTYASKLHGVFTISKMIVKFLRCYLSPDGGDDDDFNFNSDDKFDWLKILSNGYW